MIEIKITSNQKTLYAKGHLQAHEFLTAIAKSDFKDRELIGRPRHVWFRFGKELPGKEQGASPAIAINIKPE